MSLKKNFSEDRIDIDDKIYSRHELNKIIKDFNGTYVLNPFERGEYGFAIPGIHKVYDFETKDVFIDIGENRKIKGIYLSPTLPPNILLTNLMCSCHYKEDKSRDIKEVESYCCKFTVNDEQHNISVILPDSPNGMYLLMMTWAG